MIFIILVYLAAMKKMWVEQSSTLIFLESKYSLLPKCGMTTMAKSTVRQLLGEALKREKKKQLLFKL